MCFGCEDKCNDCVWLDGKVISMCSPCSDETDWSAGLVTLDAIRELARELRKVGRPVETNGVYGPVKIGPENYRKLLQDTAVKQIYGYSLPSTIQRHEHVMLFGIEIIP